MTWCHIIKVIVTQEKVDIKSEILGITVSVIFEGTTRLVEAMAIIINFNYYHGFTVRYSVLVTGTENADIKMRYLY